MEEDRGAWGPERCGIEREGAEDLGMGGQLRVDAGATEQVEGKLGLRQEQIPKMEWEVGVGGAKTCDEVVFESSNGTFGSIAPVVVGGH